MIQKKKRVHQPALDAVRLDHDEGAFANRHFCQQGSGISVRITTPQTRSCQVRDISANPPLHQREHPTVSSAAGLAAGVPPPVLDIRREQKLPPSAQGR
jgi:hypothetical protein